MIEALGVTLIDFVLQGALVALLLAAFLALGAGASARVRYAASCAALAALLVLPAVRFVSALRERRAGSAASAHGDGRPVGGALPAVAPGAPIRTADGEPAPRARFEMLTR